MNREDRGREDRNRESMDKPSQLWIEVDKEALERKSLLELLLEKGHSLNAVCGGTGRCGKCKIRVTEGDVPIADADRRFFTTEELERGWRLACTLYPETNIRIALPESEGDFAIVGSYISGAPLKALPKVPEDGAEEYHIAIDIGTTTLALQLWNGAENKLCHTVTSVNSQRKYGADVISRMQASQGGRKEELQACIQRDLQQGIQALCRESGIDMSRIKGIAIGCNTTMGHLLLGYDCSGLGVYPYTPVNIAPVTGSMEEILGMQGAARVEILPGISTYVGGDIVAGLYACGFSKEEKICLLVDLGTNGEMALGNRHRILTASTAAGPAFEGGNISWGMGSVAGAICSVRLEQRKARIQTIQEKPPVGICGTGVVEVTAELLREGLVDDTGLLEEEYFQEGFPLGTTEDARQITFTQKDIRELQLAKAAIRAGIETLMLRYGITPEQVGRVYIAGGFGYHLDAEKAIAIGMLPEAFANRTRAVGNSSLAGAAAYLRDEKGAAAIRDLLKVSEEISLSLDEDFNDLYMEAMMFPGNGQDNSFLN